MKVVAAIPARLQAQRFPKKLLAELAGKPVIQRTYEAAAASGLFHEVVIITDSEEIEQLVHAFGGKCLRSRQEHETGSDRIAEHAAQYQCDVVVNVQGDEPFTRPSDLKSLIDEFAKDKDKEIQAASLKIAIDSEELLRNPNAVKVICDQYGFAIYFSRSPIPFVRAQQADLVHYRHVGIYAFRSEALLKFSQLPPGPLERAEKIEAIRFLEYGMPIKMLETQTVGISIDTPEDLQKAEEMWRLEKRG